MKLVSVVHFLDYYIWDVLITSYILYPTVSLTHCTSSTDRLSIICMHISEHTSLWTGVLSHHNMSSSTHKPNENCLPPTCSQTASLSIAIPGSCPLLSTILLVLPSLSSTKKVSRVCHWINPLKPTGHVMHQQFNIQQLYVLPTLYLCVLYLSENKQRLVPLTAWTDWFL